MRRPLLFQGLKIFHSTERILGKFAGLVSMPSGPFSWFLWVVRSSGRTTEATKTMKRVLLLSTAIMAAFVVAQGRVELRAILVGAKGKAVWKVRDKGPELQAQFQMEAERLAPGGDYTVEAGGFTWETTANGFGAVRVTDRWTTANRPNITPGSVVTLEDANGNVVATGTFQ